jgi:hypothetical protein
MLSKNDGFMDIHRAQKELYNLPGCEAGHSPPASAEVKKS